MAGEQTTRHQRYYLWTVGCQMNVSDSERLEAALQQAGYQPTTRPDEAGFIVLNSCSVRASAENRVIGKLGELQRVKRNHPDIRIVLWGCMVGPDNESIFKEQLPIVDHFVAPSAVGEVLELAPPFENNPPPTRNNTEQIAPIRNPSDPPVSVAVPIQNGCNMSCSYCVIPQRRGNELSRPLEEIRSEVQQVVGYGAKEVILLGQIVDSWGRDLPGRPDLATLLDAIHDTPGLERLRFLTSHPAWMTPRLIETVARLPRCQPEINLPLQAGHDAILTHMRRGYTVARYREVVGALREAIPGLAITTDIIVGHPGETETHFAHTAALLEELRFDKVHIAAFCARPGTLAARLETTIALAISQEEKQTRRRRLEQIQSRIATEINARLRGQTVEVLVEGESKNKWFGRTGTNKLVFFEHPDQWKGHLVNIRITHTSPWSLQGQVATKDEMAT
jgi:tRNA-2-methylthio-N6-dimethylallyladenosine synthase